MVDGINEFKLAIADREFMSGMKRIAVFLFGMVFIGFAVMFAALHYGF